MGELRYDVLEDMDSYGEDRRRLAFFLYDVLPSLDEEDAKAYYDEFSEED